MCWGIVDFRANNVAPCPSINRASKYFSEDDIQKIQKIAIDTVKKQSSFNNSVKSFIEIILSNSFSICKLAKCKRANGISGLLSFLYGENQENGLINIHDADTQYIAECLDATYVLACVLIFCISLTRIIAIFVGSFHSDAWIRDYNATSRSERTVDVHLIAPFARTPNTIFL